MISKVTTLFAGNVLAQLVHVVTILVVVGGYFEPAVYGTYAVAMSCVGIVSSVASLRYEMGIVSARGRVAAANLAAASAAIAFAVSLAGYWLAGPLLDGIALRATFGATVPMIASLVFCKALEQIAGFLLFRREAYFQYSVLRFVQALVLLAAFALAARAGATSEGLLLATLASYGGFAAAGFAIAARNGSLQGVRLTRMRSVLRRNRDFLRYSAPQTLIDNALAQGINLVLAAFAGTAIVGYYNLLQRVIKAPLSLLFAALSQVVFRHCAKNRDEPSLVAGELARIQRLVVLGLLAALLAVVFVREIFAFLPIPDRWSGLGGYLLPFSVWMLASFLASPFATLPIVYDRQRQFFFAATAFNLSALIALTALFRAGFVAGAFWSMGLVSVLYYLGMNRWLLGFVDDRRPG